MTRIARADVVLLVLSLLFGALTVSVAYGFALEYGDTGAGWWASALDGLRSWWFGIVVVAVLTVGAVLLSWGSLLVRTAAVVLVLGTVVGTGAGAAAGVEQKLSRYPTTPRCTEEFTSGPAVPVVRAAQAVYDELDHPGPFTDGGSSGVGGCSSQLAIAHGTDPRPAYRRTLLRHGWTVATDNPTRLRAVRGDVAFEVTRNGNAWTVWVGPGRLGEQPLDEGEVGPRR